MIKAKTKEKEISKFDQAKKKKKTKSVKNGYTSGDADHTHTNTEHW
jgi:hypothetical protein